MTPDGPEELVQALVASPGAMEAILGERCSDRIRGPRKRQVGVGKTVLGPQHHAPHHLMLEGA